MTRRLSAVAVAVLALAWAFPALAGAASLEKLAKKLEKGVAKGANRKVAVLGFPYPGGGVSSGSTIVQERLTTHLGERGKVELIERNRIQAVLDEMRLEQSGIIDEKTTHELGKVLGVAALVTGTLNDLPGDRTEVNARLIDAQTGKILAAGMAEIERTWKDSPVAARRPIVLPGVQTAQPVPDVPPSGKALVQMAILLDTSNSMDGLIDQARTQLWKIVNELASSEKGGNKPALHVAVYEYGNDSLSAGEGFVRQVLPFTGDLDKVSEALFSLKTNGGQEFCGQVLRDAVLGLQWAPEADVYKAVFIAGNEPFTQGPTDFRGAVEAAKAKGIFVNTIFCGRRQEGEATQWRAGAELSGGDYSNIDQDRRIVAVRAPQDDEIELLGEELNQTYVPLGAKGQESFARQAKADSAAAAVRGSGAGVQRALFKAAPQYAGNASWDAVSAMESGASVQAEELPPALQAKPEPERKQYLKEQGAKRKNIQERINKLSSERQRYIVDKENSAAKGESLTLDQAVLQSVRKQAEKRQFKFK